MRLEMGNRFASPHDREVLTSMLDGIEQISEVPGGVRRRHIRHNIRLSDSDGSFATDALRLHLGTSSRATTPAYTEFLTVPGFGRRIDFGRRFRRGLAVGTG